MTGWNKFLVLFFLAYCAVLYYTPKELPKDTLNISIEGTTVRHYQRARGECARTKAAMDDLLRGLGRDDQIIVKCLRTELIPQHK